MIFPIFYSLYLISKLSRRNKNNQSVKIIEAPRISHCGNTSLYLTPIYFQKENYYCTNMSCEILGGTFSGNNSHYGNFSS